MYPNCLLLLVISKSDFFRVRFKYIVLILSKSNFSSDFWTNFIQILFSYMNILLKLFFYFSYYPISSNSGLLFICSIQLFVIRSIIKYWKKVDYMVLKTKICYTTSVLESRQYFLQNVIKHFPCKTKPIIVIGF